LPDEVSAHIDLNKVEVPKVFGWLARVGGMSEREMLRTFNCGVGMICVIAEAEAERLVAHLYDQGERTAIIGTITERGAEPVTFDGKLAL
jgi:phosphoribosylformylglycinamidine cyclo-ligase